MSTKRITKQVRLSEKWHSFMKLQAKKNTTVISKLLDEACADFAKKCKDTNKYLNTTFPKNKTIFPENLSPNEQIKLARTILDDPNFNLIKKSTKPSK